MVKNRTIRGATGALALACLLLVGDSVFAGDGDYDFDFDVDADDFAYWGSCMTVPDSGEVEPFTPCAAFDFDNDGDVDNYDFGAFQAAFQKPVPPCKSPDGDAIRIYAGAGGSWYPDCIGTSASIKTRTLKLCGEPTSDATAASMAWTGVAHLDDHTWKKDKWFQFGYMHIRANEPPSTNIRSLRYAETKYDITKDPITHVVLGVPTGIHTYKCSKVNTASGFINFWFDGVPFYTYEGEGWDNVAKHFNFQYRGEITHKDDDMVGTSTEPCTFTDCKFKTHPTGQYPDGWRPTAFRDGPFPGSLKSDDWAQWHVRHDSPTAISVWDLHPN